MNSKHDRYFINHLFTEYVFLKCQREYKYLMEIVNKIKVQSRFWEACSLHNIRVPSIKKYRNANTVLGTKVDVYLEWENKPPEFSANSGPFLWRSLGTITNKEMLHVVNLASPLYLKLTTPRNSQHAPAKTLEASVHKFHGELLLQVKTNKWTNKTLILYYLFKGTVLSFIDLFLLLYFFSLSFVYFYCNLYYFLYSTLCFVCSSFSGSFR